MGPGARRSLCDRGHRRRRTRPAAARSDASDRVNPWHTLTVAVASIDYVKRPEVLPAAQSCAWDLVILDEAHSCAGDSGRGDAARALASTASCVLLLRRDATQRRSRIVPGVVRDRRRR